VVALENYTSFARPKLLESKEARALRNAAAKDRAARLTSTRPALRTLFVNERGAALSRVSLGQIVRYHAQRAGLPEWVSPHTLAPQLRHAFACKGGADLRAIQEMLGHADIATTQIYTHVETQHLRESYRKAHPRA
jgi:integrase/recombinase XerD